MPCETYRLSVPFHLDGLYYNSFLRYFGCSHNILNYDISTPYTETKYINAMNAIKYYSLLPLHYSNGNAKLKFIFYGNYRRLYSQFCDNRVDICIKCRKDYNYINNNIANWKNESKYSEGDIKSILNYLLNKKMYLPYNKAKNFRMIEYGRYLSNLYLFSTTKNYIENLRKLNSSWIAPGTPLIILDIDHNLLGKEFFGNLHQIHILNYDKYGIKLMFTYYNDLPIWIIVKKIEYDKTILNNIYMYLTKMNQELESLKIVLRSIYVQKIPLESNFNIGNLSKYLNHSLSILDKKKYYGFDNKIMIKFINEINELSIVREMEYLCDRIKDIPELEYLYNRAKRLIMNYDVFISHASEDKESIVEPLLVSMKELGLNVWYDKDQIKLGNSFRKSIDDGLSKSKYGIVILSKSYINKYWTIKELDALFSMGVYDNILPILYDLNYDELKGFSPLLASICSRKITPDLKSINAVAEEISNLINSCDVE